MGDPGSMTRIANTDAEMSFRFVLTRVAINFNQQTTTAAPSTTTAPPKATTKTKNEFQVKPFKKAFMSCDVVFSRYTLLRWQRHKFQKVCHFMVVRMYS